MGVNGLYAFVLLLFYSYVYRLCMPIGFSFFFFFG